MAGDPDLGTTEKALYLLDEAGADVIELGVPYSVSLLQWLRKAQMQVYALLYIDLRPCLHYPSASHALERIS